MQRYYQQILDFFPGRGARRPAPLDAHEVEEIVRENRRWNNAPAALDNAAALGEPNTFAVVTGQQAGLFLGPLYTIYKALGAIQLAARLSQELAVRVVPLFWIASEDHDFDEISRVAWLNAEGDLLEKVYRPDGLLQHQSIFRIKTNAALQDWLNELHVPASAEEPGGDILQFLRDSIASSENCEDLFGRQLAQLCGKFGLVLITPRMQFIRKRGAAILRKEFEHPGETSRLVRGASAAIAAIHRDENAMNAFYYDADWRRLNLEWDGSGIKVGSTERKTQAGLLAELAADPARFSYNVVTRPVVQDSIFPTLAYVAGPGEIEYFGQLPEVYQFFDVPMPVIYPRPTAALVEPRVRRALERMHLGVADILALNEAQLRARLARGAGGELIYDFEAILSEFDETLDHLHTTLHDLDPAVGRALDQLGRKIETGRSVLRERVEYSIVQKNIALELSRRKALTALRPLGLPQERVLNIWAPFLLKRGWSLMDQLHDKLKHQDRINIIEI